MKCFEKKSNSIDHINPKLPKMHFSLFLKKMTPFNAQFYHWRTDPKARGWSLPRKNAIRPMWTALHYDAAIKKKRGSQAPLEGGGVNKRQKCDGKHTKKVKKVVFVRFGGSGCTKMSKACFFCMGGNIFVPKICVSFPQKNQQQQNN